MPEKIGMLGRIENILDKNIVTRIDVGDKSYPVDFPRDIMEKTGLELKPGQLFYWEPSQRDRLSSKDFYPRELCPDTPPREEVLKVVERFLERRQNP